ncbi:MULTISPECIES: DUF4349 domain-containing protein [Halolamina]|uniref:DUF4349 domain-containing protein n=1 Tax=Halolamina pelagica TaxID=699431 RepID=A0A1I5MQ12_9EURY|nr:MULTISPECIES: DUF4349 domain-containing protein [Halolamina]NHX36115.1 DUF4349 domain-containing protein [Halolamina sp. R1-12]SFP11682.1 protein of unknown function [Halolamina pelagica]
MQRNRALAAVALACLLVLAGCTGAGNGGDGATQAALGGDEPDYEQATGTPVEEDSAASASDRMRIYTARLTVRVEAFDASRSNLSAAVDAQGGYVGSSQISTSERGDETYRDGRFTYRVPAENYSAFLDAARAEGTVVHEEENVQDVTGQHADLEARLANLRAERDRLRELYEQANDTEDVLAVQRELSDVQGEIESTEARLEALENRVAYATVTVELREERPDVDYDTDNWYDTGVVAAFLESVDGAIVALRALVVGIAYALPYLIAFGVPLFALGIVFKRFVVGGRPSIRGGDAGDEDEPSSEAEPPSDDESE